MNEYIFSRFDALLEHSAGEPAPGVHPREAQEDGSHLQGSNTFSFSLIESEIFCFIHGESTGNLVSLHTY